jgi:hypothetical protein
MIEKKPSTFFGSTFSQPDRNENGKAEQKLSEHHQLLENDQIRTRIEQVIQNRNTILKIPGLSNNSVIKV